MVLLWLLIAYVTVVQKVRVRSSESHFDQVCFAILSESKSGGSNSSASGAYKVAFGEDSVTTPICAKPINQQLCPSRKVDTGEKKKGSRLLSQACSLLITTPNSKTTTESEPEVHSFAKCTQMPIELEGEMVFMCEQASYFP